MKPVVSSRMVVEQPSSSDCSAGVGTVHGCCEPDPAASCCSRPTAARSRGTAGECSVRPSMPTTRHRRRWFGRGRGLTDSRAGLRFAAWLYSIATNVCVDVYRGRHRRPELLDLSSDGIPLPDADPLAVDPAELAVRQDSVRRALVVTFHLPPRQRTVLILREVLRWSAAEVADVTGMSVAAVNSSLQRARASLRRQRHSCQLDRPDCARSADMNGVQSSLA